ncbi:hypothetical protein GOODEAATRI_018936 [Goodea atripinnis]|uniref:Uncharacterized protein n=1 Tax=Goodea atripinnis TaxID=208336 RepID=A0ABV0PQI7_9TELE
MSQLSWQDSPIYAEMQPEKHLSQQEPPIPTLGQQPLQIMDLWEQYSDAATGRCYYVNSITKERAVQYRLRCYPGTPAICHYRSPRLAME